MRLIFIGIVLLLVSGPLFANEVWLESDLNKDGIVDLSDLVELSREWLQIDRRVIVDLMHDATFSRSSIAFLDGKEYAPDAPRKKRIAVSGLSDLTMHGPEKVLGQGEVLLSPKCSTKDYIYATEVNHAHIYRSPDGVNWEQMTDGLTGAYQIYGTQSGAILVAKGVDGHLKLFRSAAGGSDLADSTLPVPSLTLPSSGADIASLALWNFHQARNGTICVGEYGNSGYPPFSRSRIYRSADDGVAFVQVYEDPDGVKHSHRIMKHEATGRWVDVYGDGAPVNKVVKSDDDGVTWTTLDPQIDNNFQPVEFYDYGHPTNLLYGSDAVSFVGDFNVKTCKISPLYSDGDRIMPFVFSIFYYDGVFYASTFSSDPDVDKRTAAILVSSDLVHWAVYHQFRNGEKMVNRFLGMFGDKIHGIVTLADGGTWRHISFTPATVELVNGLCLDPETVNMLDTEQLSSVETDISYWLAMGARSRITSDCIHGEASLRVEGNSGIETVYPRSRPVTVGETYSGRVWLKGNGLNVPGRANWYVYGTSRRGESQYFHLSQNQWTEIVLEPITIEPGETHITIHSKFRSSQIPGPYDVFADAAQYENGPPTRWQVGGTPRTSEILSKTIETSEQWAEEILWAPECRSEWYAGFGKQYIKSWCKDSNNYLELYFDPSDSTFALQSTIAGEAQSPIKTSSYKFYRNGVIRFTVRCAPDSLQLSTSVAGPFEHISGPAVDFLRSAVLTFKTGNHNGVDLMSCTLLRDRLFLNCR